MSDEPQPPPLRLRPRLKTTDEVPAAGAENEKAAPSTLSPVGAKEPEKPVTVEPVVATPNEFSHQSAAPTQAPADNQPNKLKLKPKAAAPTLATEATPEQPAPVIAKVPSPEPEPAAASPLTATLPTPSVVPPAITPAQPSVATEASQPPSDLDVGQTVSAIVPPPAPPPTPQPPKPPLHTEQEAPAAQEQEHTPSSPPPAKRQGVPPPIPRPVRPPHFHAPKSTEAALHAGIHPPAPAERKSFKLGVALCLLGFFILLAAGSFLVWNYLSTQATPPPPINKRVQPVPAPTATATPPPPQPPAPPPTQPTTGTPGATKAPVTPATEPAPLASTQRNPIERVENTLAAHRSVEQARVDATIDGTAQPTTPPTPPQSTATSTPKPKQTYSEIAPGVSATNNDMTATTQASPAFKRLVGEMVIRGVFQGTPPRANINSRLVTAGEPVDRSMGIIFDSINAEKKTITFRDAAGNTITRRY